VKTSTSKGTVIWVGSPHSGSVTCRVTAEHPLLTGIAEGQASVLHGAASSKSRRRMRHDEARLSPW